MPRANADPAQPVAPAKHTRIVIIPLGSVPNARCGDWAAAFGSAQHGRQEQPPNRLPRIPVSAYIDLGDILGLPQACGYLDVQSPFQPEQLAVKLVRSISTRFKDRTRSLAPIADLLARQFATQPGNYLAFLSSFEYLERVAWRDTLDRPPPATVGRDARRPQPIRFPGQPGSN